MTNKDIARLFNQLASLMELHGANTFKTRSYANAYLALRKLPTPLADMTDEEISGIKGIGKSLAGKIREVLDTGSFEALDEYRQKTPPGVQEMLAIKGFGAKKIRVIWQELGAETLGEVLYACNENRLIALKGFGEKTQLDLQQKIEYHLKSRGKYHYATLEPVAIELMQRLQSQLPTDIRIEMTGDLRRRCVVLDRIALLLGGDNIDLMALATQNGWTVSQHSDHALHAVIGEEVRLSLYAYPLAEFGSKQFKHTGSRAFLEAWVNKYPGQDFSGHAEEADVFAQVGRAYLEPELREDASALDWETPPTLLRAQEIKGVIHSHTTYSDGINTLEEMARYAQEAGYEYIVITDHSQSAFYANGLKPDRVREQMAAIDALNATLAPFKIYKGIESDILSDGRLDYEEDVLAAFDFIIASVHSNLKMDENKATERLLRAIENPYTTMLGHPTGRLLLSREGYPIDHAAIIDACAAHGVSIELNANPYRLDLDWQWIQYATEKGVLISINPDAHSTAGIHDIRFGVLAARKGGLTAAQCFNTMDAAALDAWLAQRRQSLGL